MSSEIADENLAASIAHHNVAMGRARFSISGHGAVELPTLAAAKFGYGNDLTFATLASINIATSLIVLGYTLGLRLFGFRLTMGKV